MHFTCIKSSLNFYYAVLAGTASAAMWTMKVTGFLFHSGLPHKVHVTIKF